MFPRGKTCPIARVRWRCCWIEARRRFRHHECSVHNAINGSTLYELVLSTRANLNEDTLEIKSNPVAGSR